MISPPSWCSVGPTTELGRCLALDQALVNTGWCVTDGIVYSGGVITTLSSQSIFDRLLIIRSAVLELIHTYDINFIAFEQIYTPRKQSGWEGLLRVETMLQLLFHDCKLPYQQLSAHPSHRLGWRYILKLGKSTKQDVMNWVQQQRLPVQNEHEADAVCILLAASRMRLSASVAS